jgi:ribosomal protein S12 methylthiotransferase accessory factor
LTTVDVERQPTVQPGDALAVLMSFQSPYTGIVRNVVDFLHAPDENRLISVGCALAEAEPVIGASVVDHTGGSHWNRELALAAALGEALERYSAAYVPESRLITASAAELGEASVDPERFALFHETQYRTPRFPFHRFERNTRVRWVQGFALPGGEPAYLPAQLTYLSGAGEGEPLLAYSTSNGVACGATLDDAILGGLFELVERDAFMLAWYNRLSLPRVRLESDRALSELDQRFFAPTGLRYSLVDLGVFFDIPALLGVVHGAPGQLGALGVGAGCAATVAEAGRKALSESFSVRRWARDIAFEHPELRPQTAAEIRTFDDHILFYAEEQNAEHAAFLDAGETTREAGDIPPLEGASARQQITAVCERLERRGVQAYAVDVTGPDVRTAGLHVARVIAPELCQLDHLDTARFVGGRRMYLAAYEAGLVAKPLTYSDLNVYPHPFP